MMALLLVTAAAVPAVGHAGQVMVRSVSLEQAAARAAVAALVEVELPAAHVDYPVGKGCGPYRYAAHRARVIEVIAPAAESAPVEVGQSLVIVPSNTPRLVELERLACVEGTSKSPVFERFVGARPEQGGRLVVLLRWQTGYGWSESVAGAWLAAERIEAVRAAMQARPSSTVRAAAAVPELTPASDGICLRDADCQLATLACGPCGSCPGSPTTLHTAATVRRFVAACIGARASRLKPASDAPPEQPPACSPCPTPPPAAAHRPRAVCRELRCAREE